MLCSPSLSTLLYIFPGLVSGFLAIKMHLKSCKSPLQSEALSLWNNRGHSERPWCTLSPFVRLSDHATNPAQSRHYSFFTMTPLRDVLERSAAAPRQPLSDARTDYYYGSHRWHQSDGTAWPETCHYPNTKQTKSWRRLWCLIDLSSFDYAVLLCRIQCLLIKSDTYCKSSSCPRRPRQDHSVWLQDKT